MSNELATVDHHGEIAEAEPTHDPQQARIDSVAKILDLAYQKASTLQLSPEESKALIAPFPDEAIRRGAGGNRDLLYIEHAYTRERLLEVFGPGQWALISRRMWTQSVGDSERVYADCVLLIRGCYVGEAIGVMTYYPNNARLNYSDAAEGAQSEALRRITGKYLGIGLQVWKKDFCEAWKRREGKPQTPIEKEDARAEAEKRPDPPKKSKNGHAHDSETPPTSTESAAVKSWREWLLLAPERKQVNKRLPEMATLSAEDKKAVWTKIQHYAVTVRQWQWDKERKRFNPSAEEVAECKAEWQEWLDTDKPSAENLNIVIRDDLPTIDEHLQGVVKGIIALYGATHSLTKGDNGEWVKQ
jgi:hypothetical protein